MFTLFAVLAVLAVDANTAFETLPVIEVNVALLADTLPNVPLPVTARLPDAKLPVIEILLGRLTVIDPAETTGLPDTVRVELLIPTLVTVPPDTGELIVTLPFGPLIVMPLPALIRVTPVLVTMIVPFEVIGDPETCMPVPGATATLVTVPDGAPFAALVTRPDESTVNEGLL
jgi:hypothetical protein